MPRKARRILNGFWEGVPRLLKEDEVGRPSTATIYGDCHHTLVSHAGGVCDASPDDSGRPIRSKPLERAQVRRTDRPRGGYRFALGVRVPCAAGAFTPWISPHPGPGDTGTGRADQLRLISPHEELFASLYGLRNDSEAINSAYKRSHIHDRSPVLGWRRTLLDLLAWSILNNATAWWHHAQDAHGLRTAA